MTDLSFPPRRSAEMMEMSPDVARSAFRAAAEASAPTCPSCHKPVKHRQGPDWCADRQMSEKTLQDRVKDRAKRRGWRVMHVGKAVPAYDEEGKPVWITSADPGWPDLFLLNAKRYPHRLAIELKREDGVVSDEQMAYLTLMNECGIPAVVVRPSDLRLGRVNAILEGR